MFTVQRTTCQLFLDTLPPHQTHQAFCRNKAVSDGAISFFIDHFVSARVSRFVYGVSTRRTYDAYDAGHRKRVGKIFIDASGKQKLDENFSVILAKVGAAWFYGPTY